MGQLLPAPGFNAEVTCMTAATTTTTTAPLPSVSGTPLGYELRDQHSSRRYQLVGPPMPTPSSVPPHLSSLQHDAPVFYPATSERPEVPEQRFSDNPMPATVQDWVAHTLVDAVRQNRLPTQEPAVFKGDPLLYPSWRSAFSHLIESQNIPEEEKLLYLEKYVGGDAKDAIQGCFLLRSPQGLQEALATLEKRYGSSFVVAQAFRRKLDTWPAIKSRDGEGLRRFADFLRQSLVASRVIGQLGILNDAQYQKTLMDRLPEWVSRKWAKVVHNKKTSSLRYPTFEELTTFITTEAEIACEPIFQSTRQQFTSGPPSTQGQRVFQVDQVEQSFKKQAGGNQDPEETFFVEDSNQNERPWMGCSHCKDTQHGIDRCTSLLKESLERRREVLRRAGLCYACGKPKHIAKDCKRRAKCQTCKGTHMTVLHRDRPASTAPEQQVGQGQQPSGASVSNPATSASDRAVS